MSLRCLQENEKKHVHSAVQVELIAHRGLWRQADQKNTMEAFQDALNHGFGIETDVRDCAGTLVIAHDLPTGSEMTFEQFLQAYRDANAYSTLAINIKSDGLATPIAALLKQYGVRNYFCFDMSVPDMQPYLRQEVRVFARRSEYEPISQCCKAADGIWLDAFEGLWFNSAEWQHWLLQGKSVCIVSPELHKRDHRTLWSELQNWCAVNTLELGENARLMLCTDFPCEYQG